MSWFRARITGDELALLLEIQRLTGWYDGNRPRQLRPVIRLGPAEFATWVRITEKLKRQSMIDTRSLIRNVKPRTHTYRGYPVRPLARAITEQTQCDLMEF